MKYFKFIFLLFLVSLTSSNVTFAKTATTGQNVSLNYSSSGNITSCTAINAPPGYPQVNVSSNTSGAVSYTAGNSGSFSFSCTGPGGNASASDYLTVTAAAVNGNCSTPPTHYNCSSGTTGGTAYYSSPSPVYQWWCMGSNGGGNNLCSEWMACSTVGLCGSPGACSACAPSVTATPTGLSASAGTCGTGQINLSWSPVTGAQTYQLYRDGAAFGSQFYDGTATSFTDTVAVGSSHTYKVSAWGSTGGLSAQSGSVSSVACALAGCTWAGGTVGPWGTGCNVSVVPMSATNGQIVGPFTNTVSGYTGSVTFQCSNGTWSAISVPCSVQAPTTCPADSVGYWGLCTYNFSTGAGQGVGATEYSTGISSPGGYSGSLSKTCQSNGTWANTSGSCNAPVGFWSSSSCPVSCGYGGGYDQSWTCVGGNCNPATHANTWCNPTGSCAVYGSWSGWSSCPAVSCGVQPTQSRFCSGNSSGGTCPGGGNNGDVQTQACGSVTPCPINGLINPLLNYGYFSVAPSVSLCLSGNPSAVSGGGSVANPWRWTCNGLYGGTSESGLAYYGAPTPSVITLTAAPISVSKSGNTAITWKIINPKSVCAIIATSTVQTPNSVCDTTCVNAHKTEANSLTSTLSSSNSENNYPSTLFSGRTMSISLHNGAPVDAIGKKILQVNYTTDFLLSCTTTFADPTVQRVRVNVVNSLEG